MEDVNNWQAKFESCQYSDRLINKLLLLNKAVKNPVDIQEVKKAIYYAKKYHGDQVRESGEPYYSHPLEVAYMVAKYATKYNKKYFETKTLVTSILHDTIEDTELTSEMIAYIFGHQVASQVEDLTRAKGDCKLSAAETLIILHYQNKQSSMFIKAIDRLHNMQTIAAKSPDKQRKIILETLVYFIPAASHLGKWHLEQELSKLCCRITPNCQLNFLQEHPDFAY